MKHKNRVLKRTLSVCLSVLMLMSAWVFVAPTKAAAANEPTFVPDSNGGYVYFNYPGSGVVAPTWTDYAPPGAADGQDDIEWPAMTAGNWTVDGQSYNYRVHIDRANHRNEGGVYATHFYTTDLTTFLGNFTYTMDYTKPYSTEYYYPQGTKFVTNIATCHYKKKDDAISGIKSAVGFSSGSKFSGSANAWIDSTNNAAWLDNDLNEDTSKHDAYVYMGYKLTDDPAAANACTSVGIETNEYGNYSSNSTVSPTVAGKTVTWWKCNNGDNATYNPKIHSDGATDLNYGASGKTLYTYATYDRSFGPAIDCVDIVDITDGDSKPSWSSGTTYFNGAGWYDAVAINSGNNEPNLNRSASGDDIYMYYHTPCSIVNSDTLRAVYNHRMWIYDHGGSSNTDLVNALNVSRLVLSDLGDGYTIYDQSIIDACENLLNNAIPELTLNEDYTGTLESGKDIWVQYTPSSTGNFVFFTNASYDTYYELYEGYSTSENTHQDDGNASYLGLANNQAYQTISLESGTTYYFRVYGYNHNTSHSGSTKMRLATSVKVTFNATGGTNKEYYLPKGYSTLKLDKTGVTRSGHTLVGWSTSNSANQSLWKLKSAAASVPTSNKTYYALWSPNNAPTLSVNTDYTASIDAAGEVEFYQFTPSETGKYLIYGTGSTDSYVRLYDPSTYPSTGNFIAEQDDSSDTSNGNTTGYEFGIGGQQFFMLRELTKNTTYLFGVRYYSTGTGGLPFRFEKVYKVTYNANGGSGAPSAQDKYYDKNLTLSTTIPTVPEPSEAFEFSGWNTVSNATTASYFAGGSYTLNEDLNLYAVYNPNSYTITYDYDNGGENEEKNYTIKSSFNLPVTPTKTGYTFKEWKVTTPGGNWTSNATFNAGASISEKYGNVTLTAQWTINRSTLTVKPNGGTWDGKTTDQSFTENYNTPKTINNPTASPSGKHFTGWTLSSGANGSFSNGTYTFGRASGTTDTLTANYADHTWDDGVINPAATCTDAGTKTFTCTYPGCGKTRTETVAALGHDFSAAATRVHSLGNGKHNWKCSRCSEYGIVSNGTQTVNGSVDCTYGNWSNNNATTHKRTCSVCSYVNTANHTWDDGVINPAATCTDAGTKTLTCTTPNCGATKTESVAALGHTPVHHAAVAATCLEAGNIEYWTCSACSKYFSDADCTTEITQAQTVIAKKDHSYTGAVKSDGNGQTATHSFKCVNGCDQYGGAVTHTWNSGTVTTDPTCTEPGVKTYTCTVEGCGGTYTEPVNANGHTPEHHAAVASTCLADGNIEYWTCSVCSKYFSDADCTTEISQEDTVVAQKGHSYTGVARSNNDGTHSFRCVNGCEQYGAMIDGEPVVFADDGFVSCDATYGTINYVWAADGSTCTASRKCAVCDYVQSEAATVTSDLTKAATCMAKGETTYTATFVEGSPFSTQTITLEDIEINANAHKYGAASFSFSEDGHTCTASRVCEYNDAHVDTETATVENGKIASSVKIPAKCNLIGTTTYTATFTNTAFMAEADAASRTTDRQDIAMLPHSYTGTVRDNNDGTHQKLCVNGCNQYGPVENCTYGEITFTFTEDGKSCKAQRTCQTCGYTQSETVASASSVKIPATCSAMGTTTYTATFTTEAFMAEADAAKRTIDRVDIAIDENAHNYGAASFSFSEDGHTCTASRVCEYNAEHIDSETVDAASSVKTAATCNAKGWTTYTATFTNEAFMAEADAAKRTIDRQDIAIDPTNHASELIATPAKDVTCDQDGNNAYWYCASCDKYFSDAQGLSETTVAAETITRLGHDYKFNSFIWNENNTAAQVKLVCTHDQTHVTYQNADMSADVHAVTCTEDAYTVYTASYAAEEKSESRIVPGETKLGHRYEFSSFVWSEDGTTAEALYVCANDSTHTEKHEAQMSHADHAATCDLAPHTVYTATYDGHTEDNYVVTGDGQPLGHNYTGTMIDNGNGTHSYLCLNNCGTYGNPTAHVFTEVESDTYKTDPGDCTTPPTFVKSCACGAVSDETFTGSAPGHHSTGEPAWGEWTEGEDGWTCVATFECDACHAPITPAVTVTTAVTSPTCLDDGYTIYTASVENNGTTYTNAETKKVIAEGSATGHHSTGEPTWSEWTEGEDGWTCVATFECDACHAPITPAVTVTTAVTSPTCLDDGFTTYTATVENNGTTYTNAETKKVIAEGSATGHHYTHEPTWSAWTEANGNWTCIATFKCDDCDNTITPGVTVTPAVTDPTCLDDGFTTYTATVENNGTTYTNAETKKAIAEGSATGHHYNGEPTWGAWTEANGSWTCVATFKCNDCDNTITPDVSVTSVETEPTCMEDGFTTYTATVENNGTTYVNEEIKKDVHENTTVDHNYIHVKASSGYVYDRSMQWNVYECKFGCGSSYTQFSAFVRNDKGMALSGATVRVSGDNVDEEAVTDENGMATFAAHLTDGVYELRVFYDGADGVGTSEGRFTLSDGRGSGGFGSITTSGPVEEEPTTEPTNNDQPSDGNNGGNNGGNNNPAPNAPKRCSWCSINERWEGTPVIGWFVAFIHMIVHAANAR